MSWKPVNTILFPWHPCGTAVRVKGERSLERSVPAGKHRKVPAQPPDSRERERARILDQHQWCNRCGIFSAGHQTVMTWPPLLVQKEVYSLQEYSHWVLGIRDMLLTHLQLSRWWEDPERCSELHGTSQNWQWEGWRDSNCRSQRHLAVASTASEQCFCPHSEWIPRLRDPSAPSWDCPHECPKIYRWSSGKGSCHGRV